MSVQVQEHLYSSFLNGRTSDVTLQVRATTWSANYRLHRVVLIQAGFFASLWTSDFAEATTFHPEVTIVFDDTNITRAVEAFEVCISRLYGGGPPLHVSPHLIPSTSHPLTPQFPFRSSFDSTTPSGHHPATPRFLLSLLATSVYLSLPTVAAQALTLVLSTMGPSTVLSYLDFALGKPITAPDPRLNEPEAAVGLEKVAQIVQDDMVSLSGTSLYSTISEDPRRFSHYGAISDKIGEAAACWLARWAPDMLALEERKAGVSASSIRRRAKSDATLPNFSNIPTIWDRGGLSVPWICALISSDTLFVSDERGRYDFARAVVELRRRKGLVEDEEVAWKTLFEDGIYYCNMSMEDVIFISKDSSPTTKLPFVSIAVLQASHWQSSILRQHITARPVSPAADLRPSPAPTPGSPVQREKELGIMLTTAEIRARLASSDPSLDANGPYYLVPTDLSQRVGDNGSSVHPPTSNSSMISMDELFTPSFATSSSGPSSPSASRPTGLGRASIGEANFFGIQSRRYTAQGCVAADPDGTARWTLQPPFRFGVEFWDAELLPEKARLYSQTVWCGGSLFNAYVQVVRKKAVQIGIYLHRQSTMEIPGASGYRGAGESSTSSSSSAPRERLSSLLSSPASPTHNRGPSLPTNIASPSSYSPSIRSQRESPMRSPTPVSISSSLPNSIGSTISSSSLRPAGPTMVTLPPAPPAAPYRDSRPAVAAYFTISCASATGASQTRFSSAPDVFSVSQSWGWKSSSLRTEEYIEVGAEGTEIPTKVGNRAKEVSLRACVVLGLV
ncbi:BTB domain-containing protein [Mycena chlorophos]|uniref:BTB domain-containing protein n=1 Tax=Mycena chlorophos TaxID=658473 RepID=A0A8H6T4Z2_MYCCL|nr:BTB domain-containing protein [Mycena chlorophos]